MPLPKPDAVALTHSNKLKSLIKQRINSDGPLTFAAYMQMALYEPGYGYYVAGSVKFGEQGDFVTAPEISPLFSQCLARQCQQVLTTINGGDVLELAAGSGVMALEILRELQRLNCLPDHYYILDISADLKQRQQALLQKELPELFSRVVWLDTWPKEKMKGVVLANELLDAMPVNIFEFSDSLQEMMVDCVDDELVLVSRQTNNDELVEAVAELECDFSQGYRSEINLSLDGWMKGLSECLEQGLVLLIDYGFPQHEFYHPQRSMGTVMCHFQHYAHEDPLLYPGIQDITAHVDFTAVAKAAFDQGFDILGYCNQASFLLGCGIDTLKREQEDIALAYDYAQQIKKLMMPSEMGELFKVIALGKQINIKLIGFTVMNHLDRL